MKRNLPLFSFFTIFTICFTFSLLWADPLPTPEDVYKRYKEFCWDIDFLKQLSSQNNLDEKLFSLYSLLLNVNDALALMPRKGIEEIIGAWDISQISSETTKEVPPELETFIMTVYEWRKTWNILNNKVDPALIKKTYVIFKGLKPYSMETSQEAFTIIEPFFISIIGEKEILDIQKLYQNLFSQELKLMSLGESFNKKRSILEDFKQKLEIKLLHDYFSKIFPSLPLNMVDLLVRNRMDGTVLTLKEIEFLIQGKDTASLHYISNVITVGDKSVLEDVEPCLSFKYGDESFLAISMAAERLVAQGERLEEAADFVIWGYVRFNDHLLTISGRIGDGSQPSYRFWSDLKNNEKDVDFIRGRAAKEEFEYLVKDVSGIVSVLYTRAKGFSNPDAGAFQSYMLPYGEGLEKYLLSKSELPDGWEFSLSKKKPEQGSVIFRHPYGLEIDKPYLSREDLFTFYKIPFKEGEFLKKAVDRILENGKSAIYEAKPFWGMIYAGECRREAREDSMVITHRVYTPWEVVGPLRVNFSISQLPENIDFSKYLMAPLMIPTERALFVLKPNFPNPSEIKGKLLFEVMESYLGSYSEYNQKLYQTIQKALEGKGKTFLYKNSITYSLFRK